MSGKVMRLDKYLADMGVGTRSEVKKLIKGGCVKVDDAIVKNEGFKVNEDMAVECCGEMISYVHNEYYMLHKPAGVVSATEDKKDRTVLDLIDSKRRKDLFPVGRLDKDTEGLLLITNDGDMAHRLLSPKKHIGKIYYAKVLGAVNDEDVKKFADGLVIGEDFKALPAKLKVLSVSRQDGACISEIKIEIFEGKFHQVKRMFEAVGKPVLYLKRLSMGPLTLDDSLPCGAYRALTKDELDGLLAATGRDDK